MDLINKIIEEEKVKYALPVYNMNYVTGSNETIEFTIPSDLFWRHYFSESRGESIKFASHLKKNNYLQEKQLLKDISVLEQNLDSETNVNLLEEKKSIRKQRINGFITRSRIQWLSKGEKPSSFFCQLENKNYTEKNDTEITFI